MAIISDTHMDLKEVASSLPVQNGNAKYIHSKENKVNGINTNGINGHSSESVVSAVADSASPSSSPSVPPFVSPTFKLPTDPTYPVYNPNPVPRTSSGSGNKFAFDSMPEALAAFARGEFLVVMDDEGRENEGDLIIAAQFVTTEKLAWMIKRTSGYICIALPPTRLNTLQIPAMVPTNTDRHRTAYTITVDYKHTTTTGISAHDRSQTIRALVSKEANAEDFMRPGHMVPLCAKEGGVLERRGHTESAVDLCLLAGIAASPPSPSGSDEGNDAIPGGVLCELVNDDIQGSMMRRDQCRAFADQWGLKMISVEMIVEWRKKLEAEAEAKTKTKGEA